MKLKPRFLFLISLLVITTLSGCAIFKKDCDCPPVGKRRAANDIYIPVA